MKKLVSILTAVTILSSGLAALSAAADSEPALLPYQDQGLSFEERAADLVSRMTLEEKVSQIGHSAAAINRLGVSSYYYWNEALHGVARQGKATSFPTSLAMSNTWDRALIRECAEITADEARAKNNRYKLTYWSPTINMARDPRWGRNDETYGEDPYLTAQIGEAFVKGMQGDDETYLKTVATIKHFAANNCEAERSAGTSYMDEATFRDYYLKAFQDVTEKAAPASIMSSYNATTIMRNGQPVYDYIASTANEYLLTDQLRRNWGFDGFVTGDCGAFENLYRKTQLRQGLFPGQNLNSVTEAMTTAKAFNAGNNLDCGGSAQRSAYDAVQNGYMSEDTLDTAVYELFLQRMRTGEFDDENSSEVLKEYRSHTAAELEKPEHVAKAEQAAEKSWVLLENRDNLLPLKAKEDGTKLNVAVVGSKAGSVVLGDYSGSPEEQTNPYDGITDQLAQAGIDAEVNYLGGFPDSTQLFDINSITFTLSDGSKKNLDLSKGTYLSGADKTGNKLTGVTKALDVRFTGTDCSKITSVTANVTTLPDIPDCTINLLYNAKFGEGPNVCTINISDTQGEARDFTGEYTGATGGYNDPGVTIYLGVEPGSLFSVEKYQQELDDADVIIAYASTVLGDSSESNDRETIALPESQAHIQEICGAKDSGGGALADKTVVALQTVGQVDTRGFDQCGAMLWTCYNGQTQGTALGKVLTGQVNPSGKLTTTWYNPSDLGSVSDGSKLSVKADGSITSPTGLGGSYNNYNIKNEGDFPGRTYQYYTGTPVYPFGYGLSYTEYTYSNLVIDQAQADVNDTVMVSVDVTNNGTVDGEEVVQLYVTAPFSGEQMPQKQLKGFDKIALEAGETKTVTIPLQLSDITFFSEQEQKIYAPAGEYTISVGKNAQARDMLSDTIMVTGTLTSELKTVKAVPSGLTVTGIYNGAANTTQAKKTVLPNLSAVMTDEVVHTIEEHEVRYTSSNPDVAAVDEKTGVVSAGIQEGTALITAAVTVDGVTKMDTFPVVCQLTKVITQAFLDAAKEQLRQEYESYNSAFYTEENYQKLTKVYTDALALMDGVFAAQEEESALAPILAQAGEQFKTVETLPVEKLYTIGSEKEKVLVNGIVAYREGGIPVYKVTNSSISGTITGDNPFVFQLVAKEGGTVIDGSLLTWEMERLDTDARKPARLTRSGEMTIYENGLYKVKATNPKALACGEAIINVNLQIEAESCDDLGGARLESGKGGASGTSEYNDIGSSKDAWITYKGVKLSNLKEITLRLSQKNDYDPLKATYVSLAKDSSPANVLTAVDVPKTGSFTSWTELTGEVNQEVLKNAVLDENGLGTVYIQTNTCNFDFFKLAYNEDAPEPIPTEKPETDAVSFAVTADPAGMDGNVTNTEGVYSFSTADGAYYWNLAELSGDPQAFAASPYVKISYDFKNTVDAADGAIDITNVIPDEAYDGGNKSRIQRMKLRQGWHQINAFSGIVTQAYKVNGAYEDAADQILNIDDKSFVGQSNAGTAAIATKVNFNTRTIDVSGENNQSGTKKEGTLTLWNSSASADHSTLYLAVYPNGNSFDISNITIEYEKPKEAEGKKMIPDITGSAVLIKAVMSETGVLQSLSTEKLEVTKGTAIPLELEKNTKAFLWDSLSGMKPVGHVEE